MLYFQNFLKKYDDFIVLDQEELKMSKGLHIILGPNGVGKSTLLKCLAGLIPYHGKIVMNENIDFRKQPMLQRQKISFCEAEPVFPPFLTGQSLVDLFIKIKPTSPEDILSLKEQLGIGDYLQQKVGAYSSGMKKKLALLLAFIGEPSLILLDEPLTTLDREAQPNLLKLIERKTNEAVSFMLASHQPLTLEVNPIYRWKIEDKHLKPQ